MASVDEIKEAIRDIAQRPKNVTFDEIERVVKQIGQLGQYPVKWRDAKHGVLFTVGSRRFMVSLHNPGSKQVKACYVKEFLDAMIDLGLYED